MKLCTNLVVSFSLVVVVLSAFCDVGLCREPRFVRMKALGGVRGCKGVENRFEIERIGRFAVEEHNKKENALLEFARVIKAKEQVISGKMYHLTLEVIDAGKKKIYEAKVWVKPWMNFKQLEEFKHSHDVSSFTKADIGMKRAYAGN